MTLYKKKHRVESARLPGHDYSSGMYFVTVCSRKKMQWFGEIEIGKMKFSSLGKIVEEEWLKTPNIRTYVMLDEWCLMPDHLHGILSITHVETPRRFVAETTNEQVDTIIKTRGVSTGSLCGRKS